MTRFFYLLICLCSLAAFWFFDEYLFAFAFILPAAFYGFMALKPQDPTKKKKILLKLGGLTWNDSDFFRGWLGTGKTGAGKTEAIKVMLFYFLRECPTGGMLCLDQKGLFFQILTKFAKAANRAEDLKVLVPSLEPEIRTNLIGNNEILESTYSKVIVDTAKMMSGEKGSGGNPVFSITAQTAIQWSMTMLRILDRPVTIPRIYDLLMDDDKLQRHIEMCEKVEHPKKARCMEFLTNNYLDMVSETKDGVRLNINQYLSPYLEPEIANTYFSEDPNFNLDAINEGKLICFSIPQKYQEQRVYINTLSKLNFYLIAFFRFDLDMDELKHCNPIVLAADEGQESVTAAESAFADHSAAGVLREARATLWLFTQGYSSLLGRLPKEKQRILLMNLTNEIIFGVQDAEDAQLAAKRIGQDTKWEQTSKGWSAGKRNATSTKKEVYYYKPHELMKLPKLTAVVRHCEKGFKKSVITPVNPDGSKPEWFINKEHLKN